MFKQFNPFYLEETKSKLPKFGDDWPAHAAIKDGNHHAKQADMHEEAASYHWHARQALDNYLHNPYDKGAHTYHPDIAKHKQHMKDLVTWHGAMIRHHESMAMKHTKAYQKS